MNIFVLSHCPVEPARLLCDKHVVKMTLETAQILCTVLREHGLEAPYKATHKNHPCTVWAGEAFMNFEWLVRHGYALVDEYQHRYGKKHKCFDAIWYCDTHRPQFSRFERTKFALAMPDEYKTTSAVKSYQNYYAGAKGHLLKYTKRETPNFLAL